MNTQTNNKNKLIAPMLIIGIIGIINPFIDNFSGLYKLDSNTRTVVAYLTYSYHLVTFLYSVYLVLWQKVTSLLLKSYIYLLIIIYGIFFVFALFIAGIAGAKFG